MRFNKKLKSIWQQNNSLVCVGLDPDESRFPKHLQNTPDSLFNFCKAIVDATHDVVCAYKPQIAYFAAVSAEDQLKKTIDYIREHYPQVPVILDSKRGDIGSTAEKYAQEAFKRYQADAVTINPYMGFDSADPFLSYQDKGVVLLCRTSNAGAEDIQDLEIDGMPLYQHVAQKIHDKWNYNNNCLLVVGATWPSQMSDIRKIVGDDIPFLVPGVGAQGGNVEDIINAGQAKDGAGLIISSSRGVLYASDQNDFSEAARQVVLNLRDEINSYRK